MTTPVTLVTRDATLDDLSLSDYRDMVVELRGSMSIDKMIVALNSVWSKPLWAKVEKGEAIPNRSQRNELRAFFTKMKFRDLPPLPPTVAEATGTASPDAAVWQVGDGPAEHVIMVTTAQPMTLHVNGAVTVASDNAQNARNPGDNGLGRVRRQRRYIARPSVSEAQYGRYLALGAKWTDVIDAGLFMLEAKR
jgi:hypothetical protein